MNWRLIAGFLAALASLPKPAAAQQRHNQRLGIEAAVALALAHNEQMEVAVAEADRARGAIMETRARALPALDFNYSYARNVQRPVIFFNQGGTVQQVSIGQDNDNVFGLELRQTLFDASLGAAQRAARLGRGIAESNTETARRGVALLARSAYYRVLLDSQLVRVQAQALIQAEARLAQIDQRARAGLAAEFDLLTARVAAQNLRPPLIQARNQLELSRNELKRALGISLESSLELTDSLTFTPVAPADSVTIAEVVARRSDRVSAERLVALRRAAVSAERGSAWPTLDFTVGLQRRASSADVVPAEPDFSQSLVAGIRLSWPIFDSRASAGRLLQQQALLRADAARLEAVTQDIRLELVQAYQSLQAAEAEVTASQSTVSLAERALAIAQTRFQAGLSTQLELGDAELAVTQARSNHALALYRFNVAAVRWRAALGET